MHTAVNERWCTQHEGVAPPPAGATPGVGGKGGRGDSVSSRRLVLPDTRQTVPARFDEAHPRLGPATGTAGAHTV